MKHKIIRIFTVSILLFSLMSFIKPKKWFLLESKDFGYKIEFPRKPKENPQVVDSEIGELKMNIFMLDASEDKTDDNLVYMVNSTEYPNSHINSEMTDNLDEFFRNSIDGAVTNVKGKLLSEETIEIDGYPGKEVKIDYGGGMAIIKMRIYLVKNNMFMLQTITETGKDSNKSISRFMDSFELINTDSNKK